MSRIITREETGKLVRSLKEVISKNEISKYERYELYFVEGRRVMWIETGKHPQGSVPLGFKLIWAYTQGALGNYLRKNLGELDNHLYHLINGSKEAQYLKRIREFKSKDMQEINKTLRNIKVGVKEDKGGTYLIATGVREENKEEEGRKFVEYIVREDLLVTVPGVEDYSNRERMAVGLSGDKIELWNNLIKIIKKYDRELNKR